MDQTMDGTALAGASVPDETAPDRYRFVFTGSGGEYFRIWIVNVLLTILTLYVYSAWAKVRTHRYFHGNTVLDGSTFEYHARPLQILAGRIVAVALLIGVVVGSQLDPRVGMAATFALPLLMPWVLWRSTTFGARMTSYRNVRLDFRGKARKLYLYTLVLPVLPVIVAGLIVVPATLVLDAESSLATAIVGGGAILGTVAFYGIVPWTHKRLAEYFADNYRYGRSPFAARLSTRRFYTIYGQSILLWIGLLLAVWFVCSTVGLLALLATASLPGTPVDDSARIAGAFGRGAFFLALVMIYPTMLLVTAFFRASVRNHIFERTVVDQRVRLESTVRTWALWRLMLGNLALLLVTLGIAWPWVKVRLARFFSANTALSAPDGLHAVVDDERTRQDTLGEEIGDAFDMDVDVGF